MPHRKLGALAWIVAALLAGCGQPVVTTEPVYTTIRAEGSTSLGPLVADLAIAWHEQAPTVSVVVDEAGMGYGLEALRSGVADVAMVSWLPEEMDPSWRATAIARDGIAVIVHPDNPIGGVGLLQLQDLFSGRAYEWKAVGVTGTLGVVQPVSREDGSGTRTAFEELAMQSQRVTPRAAVATSNQGVVDYVASHREAIGYVSMGYLSTEVKALSVEGEAPSAATVRQGRYPLGRELWLVTADPPAAGVQEFLDFVLGPVGQGIVGQRYVRVR